MNSKSHLVMLEQLLMLLVFVLAAALCLQTFTLADSQSKTSSTRDNAIIQVQQTAETIKYCSGDMEKAAEMLGAQWDGQALRLDTDSCVIYAEKESLELPLLESSRVYAQAENGEKLFEISVAWQSGGAE